MGQAIDRSGAAWRQIHAWPKIDLHRHLEGALRLSTLAEIAREYQIPLPANSLEALRPHVQMVDTDEANFGVFLSKFGALRQFFRSREIVRRVTMEAIEDAAADNVKYLELRFTPNALARYNGYSFDQVIEWVCDATAQAQSKLGTHVRLIVSVNRHESLAIAERTLAAALDMGCDTIAGIDLAGLEVGHSADPFQSLFRQAHAAGLGVTIHAGEWDGPKNIHDAVTRMGADRIGHGVRIVESRRVLDLVRERGVPLEICPTSNLQTGAVHRLEEYPLAVLVAEGICATINTDDPSLSGITLTDELTLAYTALGLSMETLKTVTRNAAQAAFLPDAERAALVEQFDTALCTV
ncbi:adenosine deaminase [Aggregatilinea lenta]|uniref:adenosine deaminase n=1 Tax=Aggregatilinea lenta TaxID=913108 RepID=UPI0013C3430B|nr:adenosine deaminase [Aggregatilinea lenta]